jgi:asparagine synthase (glutamine-hydrolysing)
LADLAKLRDLVGLAVEQAIEPDATGVVVSGGIDSATVCTYTRIITGSVPTFTGWYDTPGFDERHYARLVAGPNHHEVRITPNDFIAHFDDMVEKLQPPYQGMGTFGQYMVGRYIANNSDVKVVLSGEGADELFGGYARLMKVAGEPLPDGYDNYTVPDVYPDTVRAALAYDFVRLDDLLAVDDQCMNAHGLEARAPFTDVRIIEYALALEDSERINKRTLKAAMRDVVPDAILDRTDKCGFPIPLNQWAQGPLRDFVGDRIGYIPDPDRPWDRGFWYDLLNSAQPAAVAA